MLHFNLTETQKMTCSNTFSRLITRFIILLSLSITSQANTVNTEKSLTDGEAINIAGRQRMLSERMVKAYIQLSIEVDMQKAQIQLDDATQLFQAQLQQLIDYAPTGDISANLDSVQQQWLKVATIMQTIPNPDKIPELIILGEELVIRSHRVVLNIQQFSGKSSAALVNTSGRQRMLSQRMAKYYFAHLSGQRQADTVKHFETSVAEFEKGLMDLSQAPENSPEISQALKKVEAQLKFSKSGFKGLEQGNYAPHVISRTTESMLKRMEAITQKYVALHDAMNAG